jgi:trehalose 6-phosphate phosphatase
MMHAQAKPSGGKPVLPTGFTRAGGAPVAPKPQEIALFLDVDGTLLDLAPHPEAVEVPAGLTDSLAAVERRLDGALALVSGRPVAALDRIFAPLRLRAAGVHGAETRWAPESPVSMPAERQMPGAAWIELSRLIGRFPGTFAEDKRASFAVHYQDASCTRAELAAALIGFASQFAEFALLVTAGHRVFEIRRPGFDKGKAIESFMVKTPFRERRPVFVADDAMDRPGFDAVLRRGGLGYSVGRQLPGLSGWFPEPAAVRAWLAEIGR